MLKEYRKKVNQLVMERDLLWKQVDEEEEHLKKAGERLTAITEAQQIVQDIAQTIQQQAHDKIASVVTKCLQAVFQEEAYDFQIDFVKKRGKTEANLIFERDGLKLEDPLNEVGGGVIDVASLALRLACIMLARPKKRRMVILDEPFKNIRGEGNKSRTRQMLMTLAEEMDLQFVINTDIQSYQLGTVVELG